MVRRLLVAVFGRVSWELPGWLRHVGGKLAVLRAHKGKALVALVALAGIVVGGTYGLRWYRSRPKPNEIQVSITAPGLTRVADVIRPQPVLLDFAGSAAPLKSVGRNVSEG